MKKLSILLLLSSLLLISEYLFGEKWGLHSSFRLMVLFFTVLTYAMWRMESWAPKEWQVHVSLVKVVVRLLASLTLITVLLLTKEDKVGLTLQFVGLYLGYMVFEIVFALTNLRRN